MRRRIVVALGCLSATVLLTQIVTTPPSFAAGQSTQTAQVMHAKLEHSGQLLAALVTSDWASFGHHARALQDVTTKPGWDVLRLPEFNKYTNAFQHSTEALVTAADARDQRSALRRTTARRELCGMPPVCRAGPHRPRTLIRRRTRQSCEYQLSRPTHTCGGRERPLAGWLPCVLKP